ncbi:aminotransferase class I/II-fold pyridoxal phosphate-dependent enzyme [Faecalicatena contorta]|uniref:Arginine/lysine/ornithine decarboxylase n=1 Tax=Faecalicatena contorta TaxID=39482 RepID=A0A315ZQ73_9FIRM|nr:aminotransferase class I/II-fold pyridoxal phosphate-dependent enzyme [Faecalicatena contorta]PWJ47253.1 arginine/lysine/ornithine decarboxylase [Faecalicatena contorta]SUQ16096.1 Arginine/lysine/ornithine decarboxylase [Faecalicatena contorta]
MNLYEMLKEYNNTDYYGFHMPGHKRNQTLTGFDLPYTIDITEIEEFDDLHHAGGILKEAENRASVLYGGQETCYLINGSTSGILSAVMGCTSRGDKILVSRNCHKSVYHAIYMNGLKPVYIYPRFYDEIELNGPVEVSDIEALLQEHLDIKAVVITSPTYDGVVSDVEAIVNALHQKNIPLIVDEAHGAHFGFHPYFPENSNAYGADVVIHSLHKTLPSLTQTALIHMNGNLVNRNKIRRYLHMLQTSSPSYVLMAGMDACIELLSKRGQELFGSYAAMLEEARRQLKGFRHLNLLETEVYDKSKLVISVKDANINSRQLYEKLLNQYHLQMEMTAGSYVLAMTSIGDTREGIERLTNALLEIDSQLGPGDAASLQRGIENGKESQINFSLPRLKQKYTSAEVDSLLNNDLNNKTVSVSWQEAVGQVSAEYAYVYPPGIPLIVPGEEISQEAAGLMRKYKSMGFSVEGPEKEGRIEVLVNG